ncbi:hypothetical protein RRG08_050860 [Elysia crispata]|uniref:G-protein coupled receptors family 1 profile domain-containing protein n=1 Tax=Elysia crispata TaxID=231223 RepID=A0AAE1DE36_9GAST|nr:hypothetical protein RRG08_050860 [Elysia crispata]
MANNISVYVLAGDWSSLPFYRDFLDFSSILTPAWPIIILAGLITNTVNIVVFLKAGVKDSVTTLLLTLSVSDVIFLTLIIPTVISWQIKTTPTTTTLHLLFYWPAMTVYDYSSYISVFLGVTRCACVVKPLHFKSVFTKGRTVAAVFVLLCIDVLLHIPVLSFRQLKWVTDPTTNTSRLTVVRDFVEEGAKAKINDAINKNGIAWTLFVVMIACTLIFSYKLFESSKIRSRPASERASGESSKKQEQKLSSKDVHVVKSVVLVCTIFIVAQLPAFCYSIARMAVEEFKGTGNLVYLAAIAIKLSLTCSMINATINIFVYYNCNSKYRAVFRALLRISDSKTT